MGESVFLVAAIFEVRQSGQPTVWKINPSMVQTFHILLVWPDGVVSSTMEQMNNNKAQGP